MRYSQRIGEDERIDARDRPTPSCSRQFEDSYDEIDKSTSMMQLTDNPNCYEQDSASFEDELTTYLKEVNERIKQCETDYMNMV